MTIGRTADNDIVLAGEPTVSRVHAELVEGDSSWFVRDLGSSNGTHVNGERLTDDDLVPVGPNDVLTTGAVAIRLVIEDLAPGRTIEDSRGAELHRLLTMLSTREQQVLAVLASGSTDDQIANQLFISVKTVHSHLDRIRNKTGVRRRAELTRLAVRLGLSNPANES